ncbi:porin [Roseomonas sp. GC11]|uniref:porin n=1 Tax=Roseomonas sp. GC11 TaxID=2950546 RepID=UPI00210977F0|nr:porin [Roseomonas sp. GC11]MCQ4162199.1 porin [Roseomonas sp. GC11]
MRKLLLGTTAVVGAVVMASTGAMAQGADPFRAAGPAVMSHRDLEVRVGGYFRYYYSNTTLDYANTSAANMGKSDFAQEVELHFVANGKAANGLRYGVAIEVQNDGVRQATSGTNSKNSLDLDEAWGYVAGDFGQVRMGDEDPVWALMSQGQVANFASGGLDGDFYDSVAHNRPVLSQPSDAGDATKIIYMSPQFAGFDFGASFAFNTGEGPLNGCTSSNTSCDTLASTSSNTIAQRRNEINAVIRYRGSFSGVGIGATAGYFGADVVKNTSGVSADRINVGQLGLQLSAYGFLVGGQYLFGDAGYGFYTPRLKVAGDDRNFEAFNVGLSYTMGAFTVGTQYGETRSVGVQSRTVTTGGRTDKGWSIGGTYRVAPGIEYVAEYTSFKIEEAGYNFSTRAASGTTANNSVDGQVFLTGFRFAF